MNYRGAILSIIITFLLYRVKGQTQTPQNSTTGCLSGPSTWYNGTVNVTYSGIACQRWDRHTPHVPRRTPQDGPHHNYCRNPDNDPAGTWCYTMDPSIRWQFCRIPKCPDSSLLLYSTDARTIGELHQILADTELSYPSWQPSTLYNRTDGLFWSLAADKHGERVFFTDISTNALKVFSFSTNQISLQLQGMMKDAEQIAFDWKTGNIYWNDYKKKLIMATERTFQYYTIIYQNQNVSFHGLTLHAGQRLLFFSITTSSGLSRIYSSDLAGRNVRMIYPLGGSRRSSIKSLSVDYTDDKIYWAVEYPGSVTQIFSASLNGSSLKSFYTLTQRAVWSVVSYLDYVYIAEHTQYYSSSTGTISYRLKIVTKNGGSFRTVRQTDKVRAMAIYSDREEFSQDPVYNGSSAAVGQCSTVPACEQICLPRLNARRECACLPGFVKSGDTRCITNPLSSDYLVLYDRAQKRIFQLSIDPNDSYYAALETGGIRFSVGALTSNPVDGSLYIFDRNTTTLYKTSQSGRNPVVIRRNVHVKSLVVDPLSGNIYYADGDTETINVISSSNGNFMKNLTSPPANRTVPWDIQSLTIDVVNKYIYWILGAGPRDMGELRRIGLDGSNETIMLSNLRRPKFLFLDSGNRSIFISFRTTSANSDVLYKIPLNHLQSAVNGRIPSSGTRHTISYPFSSNGYLKEFIIVGSEFYIATTPADGIRSVKISDAIRLPAMLESVAGKNYFYEPEYFSIYNSTTARFYRSLPNACQTRTTRCDQFCFLTAQNTSVCSCSEGFVYIGGSCQNSSGRIDLAPSYGSSCPQDFAVQYYQCQNPPTLHWTPPVWTDDHTAVSNLITTSPTIQPYYTNGSYLLVYTATDEMGNTGYCSFTVTVTQLVCQFTPLPSAQFESVTPSCDGTSLVFQIRCRNPSLYVQYRNGSRNRMALSICQRDLTFSISNYSYLQCVQDTVTTTALSTTISIVSTTSSKITTKNSNDEIQSDFSNNNRKNPVQPSLSGGGLAAVIVVTILLVVILVGFVFVWMRRKNGLFIHDDGTPVFTWNKTGDKEVSKENIYHHL